MRGIVAPAAIAGEFGNWHDLDDIHAEALQIVEFLNGRLKRSDFLAFSVTECAYVQLVNHYLVDLWEMRVIIAPIKRRIIDDRVAYRIGHFTGVRIDTSHFEIAILEEVAIFVAYFRVIDLLIPITILFLGHRIGALVPVVERPDDGNKLCVGSPHTKCNSLLLLLEERSHTARWLGGRSAHGLLPLFCTSECLDCQNPIALHVG